VLKTKYGFRSNMQPCSYAWRGFRGVGKRTQLLKFLEKQATKIGIPFDIKKSTEKSSEGLLKDLKFVFKRVFGEQLKEEAFTIYEDINRFFINELEKI
jgi:hypothetical protein